MPNKSVRKPLTDIEKYEAKRQMEIACCSYEMRNNKKITDVKEAECILQDALEKFNKDYLKDPNVTCWWQLTNYEDIFDYLFFGRHTLFETIDHFSSILSHPN